MPIIRPSSDLRNNYNEISTICHETNKPIYITRNGAGDLAVMSIELYEKLTERYDLYNNIDKDFKSNDTENIESTDKTLKQQEVENTKSEIDKKEETTSTDKLLPNVENETNEKLFNEKDSNSKIEKNKDKEIISEDSNKQKHKTINTILKEINMKSNKIIHNEVESADELLQEVETDPVITNNKEKPNSTDVKSTPVKDIYNTDWIFEDLNKMLEDIKP